MLLTRYLSLLCMDVIVLVKCGFRLFFVKEAGVLLIVQMYRSLIYIANLL